MTNPCKDCEFRRLLCHSECEAYKAWRKEYETGKEKARTTNAADGFLKDSAYKIKRKRNLG